MMSVGFEVAREVAQLLLLIKRVQWKQQHKRLGSLDTEDLRKESPYGESCSSQHGVRMVR